MFSLIGPLSWADPLGQISLRARYAKQAVATRDRLHLARALADEITRRLSERGLDEPTKRLVEQYEGLCRELGAGYEAEALIVRATWCWIRLKVREAERAAQRAEELLSQSARGRDWERSRARSMLLGAWLYLGQLSDVKRWAEEWLREAKDRGDLYEQTHICVNGGGALRHLFAGRPERALEEIDECMRAWPEAPLRMPHAMASVIRSIVDLYAQPAEAYARLAPGLAAVSASPLRRVSSLESRLHQQAARALLAKAALRPAAERRALLSAAEKPLRAVARERSAGDAAVWLELSGQAALVAGKHDLARQRLTRALEIYEHHGKGFGAEPIRYLLGRMLDTPEGRAMTKTALDRARACGVVSPRRYFAAYAVTLPVLEAERAQDSGRVSP
jgi:tetratricopeptide (TPR) repeat protein